MKTLFLSIIAFLAFTASYSQSSFKRLPKPAHLVSSRLSASQVSNKAVKAFRFTGPIAGYMYPQNMVVTGFGYGFQRMHFVDSTQKYYVDFSISGVAYIGGNVVKTSNPYNIASIGISLGVLNQLIMIGPAYNLPAIAGGKGSIGVVFNIAVPLNN